MKIGLNGQKLLIENPAGPEKYTFNLYKALSKIDENSTYTIYFSTKPKEEYFRELTQGNPNFNYKVIKCPVMWTQLGIALKLLRNPVDVFFTPVHTIPMIRTRKTKFVTMIHGLEYRFTSGYNNPLLRLKIDRPIKYAIKHSDKIIVPTKATKDEILRRKWRKEDDIEIVHEGVGNNFYKRSEEEIKTIRKKFNVELNPYLFFVSTIQPRKNIPGMVEGFSLALKEKKIPQDTKLLIAGKNGWDFEESLESPRKFGVENNVNFIGRVSDEDLPVLFSGSVGFVNCSFEEGFGLPLLEAMTCETPCMVSNIPAFKEIGKDIPIYINPKDSNSIKDGIVNLISRNYDLERIKKAKDISSEFTWENTALKTLGVFQYVVKNS
ncbi:glycosyltransferase family 4 protein [candidate division WWE3 bacterium]|uniref:Glycosyltransferase family 4 protein n=1 Tax=candidate division WWE3 bacterium TaxID=2053526 RepID=A0A7X9E6R9_UNCKA|nr:glycosyltransferase family 4 protein [candidate division WWE3 bacterium]